MHFTLTDLVTDITQNAVEAGAALVELEIAHNKMPEGGNEFRFLVRDNGKGMTKEELDRAIDPFVTDGKKHPNRKIGLGLPFLIQTSEISGGGWDIKSEKGAGTTVTAWFDTGNYDTPPLGDIPGMFRSILTFGDTAEIIIRRKKPDDEYEIRKSELVDILGDFEQADTLVLLGEYLRSLEE